MIFSEFSKSSLEGDFWIRKILLEDLPGFLFEESVDRITGINSLNDHVTFNALEMLLGKLLHQKSTRFADKLNNIRRLSLTHLRQKDTEDGLTNQRRYGFANHFILTVDNFQSSREVISSDTAKADAKNDLSLTAQVPMRN